MYRFGKLPPKRDYRTLLFQNYLKEDIPAPPESLSLVDRVCTNLNEPFAEPLFPMYKNDELGDCTIAGAAHGITVFNGMIDNKYIPLEQSVIRTYYHLTGGVDSGLYMLDVVRYWRSTGIDNSKIFAFASVNSNNHTHVKQAINLFGGLFMGFQVQEKCLDEFKGKIPWQPGKLVNFGHAVYVTGYDYEGVELLTWGKVHKGTWAWWDYCVDEAYALLPPEAKDPEFTPGWDYTKLKEDLVEVAMP